jgi:hypothetical protein
VEPPLLGYPYTLTTSPRVSFLSLNSNGFHKSTSVFVSRRAISLVLSYLISFNDDTHMGSSVSIFEIQRLYFHDGRSFSPMIT